MSESFTLDSIILPDIKIYQPKNGFRFTTDSILLAGFVKDTIYKKVIEIGAGTGIISVLLAKFFKIEKIYAVEIQKESYELLCKTIELNKLQDIIVPINIDVNEFKPGENVDMIISNPPYRKGDTGYISNSDQKKLARFTFSLTIEDIFRFSKSYLKTGGYLYLSFIADRLSELFQHTKDYFIEPKRLKILYPDLNKKGRLAFMEYRKGAGAEMAIEAPLFHKINGIETEQFLQHINPQWWLNRRR
jgi:tRNA1Val (adenine37-N6)-methyltransferase